MLNQLIQRTLNSIGIYNSSGFTVLQGSTIWPEVAKMISKSKKQERKRLITKNIKNNNGILTLTSNILFKSPSGASFFCTGNSTNGWSFWKDKDGKTLDEVYRRQD